MKTHVIGGGTVVHVRPHFSISAPAYGDAARRLASLVGEGVVLHLSRMAGGRAFETNEDLKGLLLQIAADPEPSIVMLTAAVCDFVPDENSFEAGKTLSRLKTREGGFNLPLLPSEKLVRLIRSKHAPNPRKDIFLVACKTTTGASDDEMFVAGLSLLKDASANLVLVNDIHRKMNMIVTPEQARYTPGGRDETLSLLAEMTKLRAQGKFTRSKVLPGEPVPWNSQQVHASLRTVVDHCITKGAYKDLLGRNATVGHFAQKIDSGTFLTSRRSTNFNRMDEVGLVRVEADGEERVRAYGSRPSVGGQSQRIIFKEHPDVDCIVHAHVPLRSGAGMGTDGYGPIGRVSQIPNECGSHQCGAATSAGLRVVAPGIKAVYLEKHGPNVVFHHSVPPEAVIRYLDQTFDFGRHTGEANIE